MESHKNSVWLWFDVFCSFPVISLSKFFLLLKVLWKFIGDLFKSTSNPTIKLCQVISYSKHDFFALMYVCAKKHGFRWKRINSCSFVGRKGRDIDTKLLFNYHPLVILLFVLTLIVFLDVFFCGNDPSSDCLAKYLINSCHLLKRHGRHNTNHQ